METCIILTESEIKTLNFYLEKALIDAEGMAAIGFGNKASVRNIKSVIKKIKAEKTKKVRKSA